MSYNLNIQKNISQSVGFEPTLPEGIWFLVRRLNHSATTVYVNSAVIRIVNGPIISLRKIKNILLSHSIIILQMEVIELNKLQDVNFGISNINKKI